RREGTTTLLASHNLDEVETIATHAGLLQDGRLLLSGSVASLKERVCEVTISFRGPVPRLPALPQFKPLRTHERDVTGVLLDSGAQTLNQLDALGAERIETRQLSLKEIFVNVLR